MGMSCLFSRIHSLTPTRAVLVPDASCVGSTYVPVNGRLAFFTLVTRGRFFFGRWRQNLTLNPMVEFLTSAPKTTARHSMWKPLLGRHVRRDTNYDAFGV